MRRQTCTVNWSGEMPLAQGIKFVILKGMMLNRKCNAAPRKRDASKKSWAEPWKVKMVEPVRWTSREYR